MKKYYLVFFVLLLFACSDESGSNKAKINTDTTVSTSKNVYKYTADSVLKNAFAKGIGDIQVLVKANVVRVLPDDTKGDQHQRFIVELNSGQKILVAHNIDLAPRVSGLKNKDSVIIHGEYEWNNKGGVIHWTHKDSRGKHIDGWIERMGVKYE